MKCNFPVTGGFLVHDHAFGLQHNMHISFRMIVYVFVRSWLCFFSVVARFRTLYRDQPVNTLFTCVRYMDSVVHCAYARIWVNTEVCWLTGVGGGCEMPQSTPTEENNAASTA